MSNPHVLAIPYPAQGHVLPLMELSLSLIKFGFRVTFVNTEFTHKRLKSALAEEEENVGDKLHLVSIPDMFESDEDRAKPWKTTKAAFRGMSAKFEELIEEINRDEGEEITCVVADVSLGWPLEVAAKMGIRRAAFCPYAAMTFAQGLSIKKLIDEGIIDKDGTPLKEQMIKLSPTIPAFNARRLFWANLGDLTVQKSIFEIQVAKNKAVKVANRLICNTVHDFEPGALDLVPEAIPIGPLLASNRDGSSAGHFWAEDSTCMEWLHQQPPCSVIYIAFGSSTVLNLTQFQELALGLELSNRPFLWVVRPDSTTNTINNAYPEGFRERVASRAKIVSWAPQQKVLSHPSVACFLSHCGWNSTMEGVSNGVPFLCWPYCGDQLLNEDYICDVWKVGLRFNPDESGIIRREEIRTKVEQLLDDKALKARASNLKEVARKSVGEDGSSYKNFQHFIEWIKE